MEQLARQLEPVYRENSICLSCDCEDGIYLIEPDLVWSLLADKVRSRKQGGFGVGLVLCQEIAVFHKGSLKFANRAEGGACVTVELKGGRP